MKTPYLVSAAQNIPESAASQPARNYQVPIQTGVFRRIVSTPLEDAMLAGVQASHERAPGRRRDRWDRGTQRAACPSRYEPGQRRLATLGNQRFDYVKSCPIEANNEQPQFVVHRGLLTSVDSHRSELARPKRLQNSGNTM